MNNNFKKFFQKKNFIFLTLFLFIALTLVISMPKSNVTQADALSSGQTILDWGGRDQSDPKMMPVSFTFKPGTAGYSYYDNTVFYQNTLSRDGESFIVYTQYDPKSTSNLSRFNFGRIRENWRTDIGNPDMFALADPYVNYNLKKGESPLNSHDYWGDESGWMRVNWNGTIHNWEWRYMGYTYDGTPVENPYFPPDYPDPSWPPAWDVNWTPDPYHNLWSAYGVSPYANDPNRFDWWNNIAFQYPGQGFTAKGDASYWDSMMTFQTNPVLGDGVLLGHIGDPNGWWGYSTWTLPSPAVNNLRITKFTILDEDGTRIAEFTQTMDKIPNPQVIKDSPYLKRGKTYKVHVEMSDLGVESNMLSAPISLDYGYALDSKAWQPDVYNKQYLTEDGNGVSHSDGKDHIYPGDYASFDFPYTVPSSNLQNDIRVDVKVPFEYYYDGVNIDTSDDLGSITMQVLPEDMAIDENIELYDENGQLAQNILPNKKYTLRYFVDKVAGETPIGDPSKLDTNPYATIDATITDFNTINNNIKASATETLLPDGVVQVDIPNVSTPSTVLRACAVIDPIHASLGLNDVASNDGPVCKTFASEVNLAVNSFQIAPSTVLLPYGQSIGTESLTFNFSLLNTNQDNMTRHTRVVLTQGWSIVKDAYVDIPANLPYNVTWTANVPLSLGSMPFKIEINPVPRDWYEYKKDGTDPYSDNVVTNAIMVKQNVEPFAVCNVVNTSNTWSKTFTIGQWRGHIESYTDSHDYCTGTDPVTGECSSWDSYTDTHYYCVTDSTWTDTPTVDFYENFRITHVFFKSKLTSDTQGGWVDIIDQPGKIKAGYGFQLEVQTQYDTNAYSSAPEPWSSGCDGATVSPGWSSNGSADRVSLTMPYTDASGSPVVYNLTGSQSGSWDNRNTTYTLPERDAFGVKTVPEIFINETAKDATYTLEIDTDHFYGSSDKVGSFPDLCDKKYVEVQILGSDIDDLKTHLTQ